MRDKIVSERYAFALLNVAKKTGMMDIILSELDLIGKVIGEGSFVKKFLESPSVRDEDKENLINKAFSGKVNKTLVNFLMLLLNKYRINCLHGIIEEYSRLVDIEKGIEKAKVVCSIPIGEDMLIRLKRSIEGLTGKRIVLEVSEDKNIIGGLIIHLQDTVIDGSIRYKLATLKDRLLHVKVH